MINFVDGVNAVSEIFSGVSWNIEGIVFHPDLSGFDEQVTGNNIFPVEFIKQQGDADYGYSGEAYIHIPHPLSDDGLYLHITYTD
jgi:hypothetical protein